MTTIVRNRGPYTLTQTWYVNGTPTDVAAVTIGIVDAAGGVVVAPLTATTNVGSGVYTYSLADQTALNELTVTWTRTDTGADLVDHIDIKGGELFTEAQARTFNKNQFSNTTAFTDAAIADARDRITDEFARICGVAFVPTYARETLAGTGTNRLWVKWPKVTAVTAVSINGTAVTAGNVEVDSLQRCLYRTDGYWTAAGVTLGSPNNVTVAYEHGWGQVPGDIQRAALMVLRSQLQPDVQGGGIPDAAVTITDQFGNLNLLDDGSGSTYGMRFVRDTLTGYNLQARGFA